MAPSNSGPSYQDLLNSGMDLRRTIATEGKGLKAFTRDHAASRKKVASKVNKAYAKRNK